MAYLDENNNLFYFFDNYKIDVSKLYKHGSLNSENIKVYPDLAYTPKISHILTFNYKGNEFQLFVNGIKFNLIDKEINGIFYSFVHLKEIIKRYNFINPIYRKKSENVFHSLKEPEKIKKFNISEEIFIKEAQDENEYKKIYDSIKEKYSQINMDSTTSKIKFELVSVNIEKYFAFNITKNINFEKILDIYTSSVRVDVMEEVQNLLENGDEEKYYAICGPFGIGKSFTSLVLQKLLYLKGYSTLYVNLSNKEEISNLKITLIKESYFLILNEKQFLILANDISKHDLSDIWDILLLIDRFCYDNFINFLLILDQYKSRRDIKKKLYNLNVKKIFLLSSINDKDVKSNLVTQINGLTNENFNYNYYIDLGINQVIKNNLNIQDKCVINCLKDFNYLPNTIFLLENVYKWNILDFYNSQYMLALKKISKFYKTYNINYLTEIFTKKKINDSKTINLIEINKDEFLNNINDIPLKFINFQYNSINNNCILYYAFDYVKKPIENEISYNISIKRFNTHAEKSLIGGEFEKIIMHKFILDRPLFQIDSFISVNKIINMKIDGEYINIKIDDLKAKTCIFIYQLDNLGDDYDFAILYPQKKEIILIQAKYKINANNIKYRSYYASPENLSKITNAIGTEFKIDISKVYVLYISSVEYNYPDKNAVLKILNSRQINCIFYSINEDYFTSNLGNTLDTCEPTTSMEIYPNSQEYIEQIFAKRSRIVELLGSIIKEEHNYENDEKFIIGEYKKFLDFLAKTNIKSNLKSHLGEFESPFYNNYRTFPKTIFDVYALFFKIGENQTIDYSKELILVYEENNSLVHYDIKQDKKLKNYSLKNNRQYKKYHYVLGKWTIINNMELEE